MIKNIEESLKRLNKKNSDDVYSDDDKIRHQIYIDISDFTGRVEQQIDVDCSSLTELVEGFQIKV